MFTVNTALKKGGCLFAFLPFFWSSAGVAQEIMSDDGLSAVAGSSSSVKTFLRQETPKATAKKSSKQKFFLVSPEDAMAIKAAGIEKIDWLLPSAEQDNAIYTISLIGQNSIGSEKLSTLWEGNYQDIYRLETNERVNAANLRYGEYEFYRVNNNTYNLIAQTNAGIVEVVGIHGVPKIEAYFHDSNGKVTANHPWAQAAYQILLNGK